MIGNNALEIAKYLKDRKGALVMVGREANQLSVNGKSFLDYADSLAQKLDARIAATANTARELKKSSQADVFSVFAAEVMNGFKYEETMGKKLPTCIVLLGYNPRVGRSLISTVEGIDTLFLGSAYVEEATLSLPDASLSEWGQSLTQILEEL
ncbi:MAG: hypothetical protein SV375_10010 [Thermodesulfobacteriota bacterium]|nr:hypothetical protein [Thermodesulfobacteriota bacterium]